MDIDKINDTLRKELWMDFEICSFGIDEVELCGYLDESEDDKIIIKFEQVFMVSSLMSFTYEGKGDFLFIAENDMAYNINSKYRITSGYNIYMIANTNVNCEMYIVARNVKMEYCK